MTVVIGLTGSIATGKSTVSKMFADLDIPVIDADQLSREVVEPGELAYKQIVETFGEGILHKDRTIDRKQLGKVIFSDKEKRQQLNDIVHPEVRREMIARRESYKKKGAKAVVLDIPLLFESELTDYADRTLVVYIDEQTQLERLMARDDSKAEEAKQRIDSQIPISKKARWADAVIDNRGTVDESFQQLKDILHRWEVV
ncbi:dephospho-CoA kinase [Halobacillus locisalis]|uniref:Dephospho-CoA kinase n=1 Tax=Halobacillus locisalis TaxID=220753 RepID=A0A838CNR0_9BACI|nr:dephospho-CoA kinase [Halobacillus locisalis]MBA2173365.1 dephospho-CoA kinase [Halobacillus locisalis]